MLDGWLNRLVLCVFDWLNACDVVYLVTCLCACSPDYVIMHVFVRVWVSGVSVLVDSRIVGRLLAYRVCKVCVRLLVALLFFFLCVRSCG